MPLTKTKIPAPESIEEVLDRYPRLTSHLICASLGYFTPRSAANAILQHIHGKECYCEWYYDWATKGNISALEVGRKALTMAIRFRHHHKGYMAEYQQARALVESSRSGKGEPMFASWF